MIHVFLPDKDEWSRGSVYLKSDKNSKEVPMAFNAYKKRGGNLFLDNINDDEYGIYQMVRIPYDKTQEWLLEEFGLEFNIISRNEFFDMCKRLNEEIVPTNESIIREATKKYLESHYDVHFMQDEFTHTSLSVRADIFAVTKNRKIITVEVKSDRDTFTRLRKQLEEYDKFSHMVYLAIDIKHLAKFRKNYKAYYGGILVYEDGELRRESSCCKREVVDVSNLLWKQEWVQMMVYFKGSVTKYSVDHIRSMAEKIFTVDEFRKISEYLFTNRYIGDMLEFDEMIVDLEYKRSLIEKKGKK